MSRTCHAVCITLILVSLSACGGKVFESSTLGSSGAEAEKGLAYHLPQGVLSIKILPDEDEANEDEANKYTLTTEVSYMPDPSARYILQYNPNHNADDVIDAHVAKGLLTNVNATSHEQTDEIIVELTKSLKEGVKAATFLPGAEVQMDGEKIKLPDFIDVEIGAKELIKEGRKKLGAFEVTLERVGPDSAYAKQPRTSPQGDSSSVYYRILLPYKLTVLPSQASNFHYERIVYLPDESPVISIDISRAMFVENDAKLTFDHGVLTDVSIKKPSSTLKAATLPFNVLSEIIKLPTEILQLKFDYSSDSEKLYSKLLEEMKAKDALIEYQRKRLESQQGDNDMPY